MLSAFLFSGSPELAKFAAWITVIAILFLALPALKELVTAVAMKLYEFFIQNNSTPI